MLFNEGTYKHESGFTVMIDKDGAGNALTESPYVNQT